MLEYAQGFVKELNLSNIIIDYLQCSAAGLWRGNQNTYPQTWPISSVVRALACTIKDLRFDYGQELLPGSQVFLKPSQGCVEDNQSMFLSLSSPSTLSSTLSEEAMEKVSSGGD